nr:myosin XVB [Molossus molossus]
MGGRKGKAPPRPEGPQRLNSGKQEAGSASADGAPSGERRQGRGKARGSRSVLEPATTGGQGTPGGRRKPTAEGNGSCRRPGAGPPPAAPGRQGSGKRRGRGSKESRKPGDSRGGRLEEDSLSRGEGRSGAHGRRRRKGKRRGPSARRGRREPLSLDGDTSGGDRGSSCRDSEAREGQESSSQSGGASELRPDSEQTDTGSGGTQARPEPALERSEHPSSDGRSSNEPHSGSRGQEGWWGTGRQRATEGSGTDTDWSPEEAPGRGPRAAPGAGSRATEAEEAEPRSKVTTSSPLEGSPAGVPKSSRACPGPRPAGDTRDKGAQPEAEPQGSEPGGAEASTARAPRQVGKVLGKVQAAASEAEAGGEAGSGDPAPLAALVALQRLRARAPPGPTPEAAGARGTGLRKRLLRVARALGLLRWLWRLLRLRASDGQGTEAPASARDGAGPRAGEGRGRGPGLRRRLGLRLAGVVGLGVRPRAPPGDSPSSPQAARNPACHDPSKDEDPAPDPKFAVVFPRIHRAGRTSSSWGSEEAPADAPAGEGPVGPCAGASRDSEEHRANGEGVAGPCRGSLLGRTPPDEPPLDDSGSSSEAEPEALEAEVPVHWAQGSDTREVPGLGADALLPRLTLERSPVPYRCQRERWEPEDEAEEELERDLELSLGAGLEAPSIAGAEGRSQGAALEDTEDLARLR